MRRLLSVVAAALLVGAGCGNAPSPSSPASVEPSVELPLDPEVLGLTCGDGLVFHPALLSVAGRAETDLDAAAAALRDHLTSPEGGGSPRQGWVRVAQTATKAQFVAPFPDGEGLAVAGFFVHEGRWTLDLAGDCRPEVVLPAGVGRAEWRLDPAFPPPAAGDRTIHVLINERACTGGKSPEGRVLAPIIAPSPTAMTIAILVNGLPGGHDCPGNPDFPMVVELPEPLGGRPLLDGAVFPPRDVTQPPA